jgi:hypothetical protein
MEGPSSNRFSSLLLEGLDHYRRGRMLDAVRSWEEAYLLEPTNLRAREFLRSALERIHARMSATNGAAAQPGVAFQDVQDLVPQVPLEALSGPGIAFKSFERHPWLRPPNETSPGQFLPPGRFAAPEQEVHEVDEIEEDSSPPGWESSGNEPKPATQEVPTAMASRDGQPGMSADRTVSYDLGLDMAEQREKAKRAPAPSRPPPVPPPLPPDVFNSTPGLRGSFTPIEDAPAPPPPRSKSGSSKPGARSIRLRPGNTPTPRPASSVPPDFGIQGPSQRSPWDDGPSVAIPQSEPPPSRHITPGGVWKIHHNHSLPTLSLPDETTVWMTAADELMALDDFTGALELVSKVLAIHPGHKRALAIREQCEHNLLQMYESRLGGTARKPRVVLNPDEVIWLNLDPRAGFVLAQIDSQVSFEDLYAICGLTQLDTARILSQLLDEGVIEAVGELNHLF